MLSSYKRRIWSAWALGAVTMLAGTLLWQFVSAPPPALAQIPDSGAQRAEMVKEQRITNERLGEVAGLLREIRDLQKAEAAKPDRAKAPAGGAARPGP